MLAGRQIKTVLIMKDIKQQEIADYLGVSKNYISMLMNEKQTIPKNNYEKIISYINLTENERKKVQELFIANKEEVKKRTNKTTKK
ncbi:MULTISPECIES: helix-turn-helix domain-containing protein [Clostridium]|uniref:helix-turn-helix domain-containing protein n=1 Tax=Clostridium TaxID=1485 RepID=UPI000826A283|nr:MULTISPECIES: helix-turn-helix transcriptional regulator [Clostridium]PJI07663.1 XRE family transcriptional regulator [Clostridium sp. CT7]